MQDTIEFPATATYQLEIAIVAAVEDGLEDEIGTITGVLQHPRDQDAVILEANQPYTARLHPSIGLTVALFS